MLTLRRLDASGRRDYLEALRPRMLVVRVRRPGRRFVWAVPLAPFEELLGFALALVLLVPPIVRVVPGRARWLQRFGARPSGAAPAIRAAGRPAGGTPDTDVPDGLLGRLSLIAAGGLGEALRMPPGTPYLTIETADLAIDVRSY